MTTLQNLLNEAMGILGHAARMDAEILLSHLLKESRTWLVAHNDFFVEEKIAIFYREQLRKRKNGEPLAYLIGKREFWSLSLTVTEDTLIPRHDTEVLVEQALRFIPVSKEITMADLGCGSGAVALAIASERPLARILATDINEKTLAVARENANQLKLKKVTFKLGDWCTALSQRNYDLVVSNPPYIAEDDPHLSQDDLRFEPRLALVAGKEGLDALREIISSAGKYLKPGGRLLVEHGVDQGGTVRELLKIHEFINIFTARDLEQRERVSGGEWQNG